MKTLPIVLLVIAVILVGISVLMLAWNEVMPTIFGLPTISFWQAFVLSLLSTALFRSWK